MRNIPAYAGKTGDTIFHSWQQAEHPRVCGENILKGDTSSLNLGTSPRMRGKPSHTSSLCRLAGNIPAYAGKTAVLALPNLVPWEHPRVCGENRGNVTSLLISLGTSPRMRGKPLRAKLERDYRRNIPAYAGKTFFALIF